MNSSEQINLRRKRKKQRSQATMKDVADLAGVSVSTVSHVINKTRYVESLTAERVLECISQLNYTPNVLAQRLNGLDLKTIGVIVSNLQSSFFHRLVSSLSSLANLNEYDLLVCDSAEDITLEKRHINTLLRKGIDGLILAPVDHKVHHKELEQRAVPFVQVDRMSDTFTSDYIGINNAKQAGYITDVLYNKGCRNIGFVLTEGSKYRGERLSGYYESCARHEIYREELVKRISLHSKPTEKLFTWYQENQPIDAIICSNADICYQVLLTLTTISSSFEKTLVFSFDNNKWFHLLPFPVHSLDQPVELIGRMAFETLLMRIEGNEEPFKNIFVDCEIKAHEPNP